jgi:2-isopropylmalate synthase
MIAHDKGAESSVRVYIQFKNHKQEFGTTGVSTNIIEASIEAITKGFRYYLAKNKSNFISQ